MNRRFFGSQKTGAHIHAFGTQCHSRYQAPAIGHPARCNERYLQLFGCTRQKDEVWHIILTGMSAAFKAVHTDGITTDSLGLQSVANSCALVDNLDTCSLQLRYVLFWTAASGFNRLDTAADDDVNVLGIRRR